MHAVSEAIVGGREVCETERNAAGGREVFQTDTKVRERDMQWERQMQRE